MSLRARLLVAIGIIALVALAIADVATYSALHSFLYQRIDQQLEQQHPYWEQRANSGQLITASPVGCSTQGQPVLGGGGPGGDHSGALPLTAFQSLAIEIRNASGSVVSGQICPAYHDNEAYTPQLPTAITGFQTDADRTQVAFFDVASTQPGGLAFRVRASTLANGNILIVAQPLEDTA